MIENKLTEYITIQSLLEQIETASHTKFDWSEEIDVDDLKKVIETVPRVTNVVERVKATWQYPDWAPNGGSYVMKYCSSCKYTPESHLLTQYCPDCGAYMTNYCKK